MLDAQQAPPDIILTNGKIITVDAQFRADLLEPAFHLMDTARLGTPQFMG